MVISVGYPATRSCEPRQVRKEAAAATDVGAGGTASAGYRPISL